MHELAITRSLLFQVLQEAKRFAPGKVMRVKLLIGENSPVVPECVQFYFDQLKKNTPAASAVLEFRRIPLRIRCLRCGREFGSIEDMCHCNAGAEITGGDELVIESIVIEEKEAR
jgi:hydrogenase nickel incorporation protein HypA/HybF